MAEENMQPDAVCKGLTFLPVPEFDDASCAFGADPAAYFDRYDRPAVPRDFTEEVRRLFFQGGSYPAFGSDVDVVKAKRAIRAWLCSFAPSHEAKESTVAYALWVWSPAASEARARQAEAA